MAAEAHAPLLPQSVYDSLRSSIIRQDLTPGDLVTEALVAARYGVSRPTAKAAIERLVAEGLLRREAHRAARIPLLSAEDISDLYDNRVIVEGHAVRALAASGAVPIDAISAQRALVASAGDFADHDIAFHRALVAGQPSARLARMHTLLMGEIELCIGQVQAGHLLDAAAVARQHQDILDAITRGEIETAVARTRDHIQTSRDSLLARRNAEGSSW